MTGLFSWDRTPQIPTLQASHSILNSLLKYGSTKTGALLNFFFLLKQSSFLSFFPNQILPSSCIQYWLPQYYRNLNESPIESS